MGRGFARAIAILAIGLAVGCARAPGVASPDGGTRASLSPGLALAANDGLEDETEDYDPWQPFNEAMFSFNHDVLDRWLMKPVATAWETVVPLPARHGLARVLDNLDLPRRLVNNTLQLRPAGVARELTRFVVNTSVGVGGIFDVASMMHIEPSDADGGQTLAMYGVAPGPYLVLPTMAPLTVRDAIGRTADGFLDPLGYVLPFFANRIRSVVSAVNERSLNLAFYANVEDSVLDLYSAARNGYLQRRESSVARARLDRNEQWAWALDVPDRRIALSLATTEQLQ